MIVHHFLKWKDSADVARRTNAASALARAFVQSDLEIDDRVAAEAALTLLLDDPSPKVRYALAEALATSAHAPPQIVTALVYDQFDIAALVVARSPVIEQRDLIARARTSSGPLQCLIAARADVSPGLAETVARYGSADSALELLSNPTAPVDETCRRLIAERFGDDPEVRGALLDIPQLEPQLRYRLMKAASAALAESRFVCSLTSEDAARHLTQDGEQRALCALVAPLDTAASADIVDTLRDEGDLTTVLLIRAACMGQIDFLASVFSSLADVAPARVTSIFVNERTNQLKALLAGAGMAESVQPVFVHAIGLWRDVAIGKLAAGAQEVTRRIMEKMERDTRKGRSADNDDVFGLLRAIHLEIMRDNARAHARDLAAA